MVISRREGKFNPPFRENRPNKMRKYAKKMIDLDYEKIKFCI